MKRGCIGVVTKKLFSVLNKHREKLIFYGIISIKKRQVLFSTLILIDSRQIDLKLKASDIHNKLLKAPLKKYKIHKKSCLIENSENHLYKYKPSKKILNIISLI